MNRSSPAAPVAPSPSSQWASEAMVFPSFLLLIPYLRFKDTHLAHHHDPALTDPYDDPESNFLDPAVWAQLPRWTAEQRQG